MRASQLAAACAVILLAMTAQAQLLPDSPDAAVDPPAGTPLVVPEPPTPPPPAVEVRVLSAQELLPDHLDVVVEVMSRMAEGPVELGVLAPSALLSNPPVSLPATLVPGQSVVGTVPLALTPDSSGIVELQARLPGSLKGPYSAFLLLSDGPSGWTWTTDIPAEAWPRFTAEPAVPGASEGDAEAGGAPADGGGASSASEAAAAAAACTVINVLGKIQYTDGTNKPFFDGFVEVWDGDVDPNPDDLIGSGYTDSNGNYIITVTASDEFQTPDIFIRAYAKNHGVRIVNQAAPDPPSDADVYFRQGSEIPNPVVTTPSCLLNYPTLTDNTVRFRLAAYGGAAFTFLISNVLVSMPVTEVRYPLPANDGTNSHYHQTDNPAWSHEIHLASTATDVETITHEFGHRVMQEAFGDADTDWPAAAAGDACPGTGHYPGLSTTTYCAWTEGWAEFFDQAARGDTDAEPFASTWTGGDKNEGNVRNALWDLYDTPKDTNGGISRTGCEVADTTYSTIWNALTADPARFANFVSEWVIDNPTLNYWAYGSAYQNQAYRSASSNTYYDSTLPYSASLTSPDDGEVWQNGAFVTDLGGGAAVLIGTQAYNQNFRVTNTGDNVKVCKTALTIDGTTVEGELVSSATTQNVAYPLSVGERTGQQQTVQGRVYDHSGNQRAGTQVVLFT